MHHAAREPATGRATKPYDMRAGPRARIRASHRATTLARSPHDLSACQREALRLPDAGVAQRSAPQEFSVRAPGQSLVPTSLITSALQGQLSPARPHLAATKLSSGQVGSCQSTGSPSLPAAGRPAARPVPSPTAPGVGPTTRTPNEVDGVGGWSGPRRAPKRQQAPGRAAAGPRSPDEPPDERAGRRQNTRVETPRRTPIPAARTRDRLNRLLNARGG